MGTRKTLKMSNFDLKKYLAENKLVKEQNITITHNDVAGDSKLMG